MDSELPGKLLMCTVFLIVVGSCQLRSNETPLQFKNNTNVSPLIYETHKTVLKDSIKEFIIKKAQAYYPDVYDSLTEITIDTIMYSPKHDKAAFFVLAKNHIGLYDANCFIATINDSTFASIKWLSFYNFSNFPNQKEASERVREVHFKEFNLREQSGLDYNLDDIRFWEDEDVWKIFQASESH